MRVVHVGKFHPPEYHGGLERVIQELNAALLAAGAEVGAVVAAVRGPTRTTTEAGVAVTRVRSLGAPLSQPIVPGFTRAVRTAAADILHLHHPNPLGDLAVLRDARPFIVTHHSEIVRQRVLRPFYGPLVRRALARAAAVVVGSEQLLGVSRELAAVRDRVRVIPFGINAGRLAASTVVTARAAELRAQAGGGPVVLAVGRLVRYKGFDVLLRAARGLDATVVIVGSGPEELRLRALARPRTVLTGRVDEADLVAWYHACDVFCLPSTSIAEAFGIVLLEAMACGKPLVTTALPTGVAAVNRDGRTGFVVPPGDEGALREGLRCLLNDARRRAAMGAEARAVQAREYGAGLMAERYLSVYREVLRGGAGAASRPARPAAR